MEIKTRRLVLRDLTEKDVPDFILAGNSKEINYFVRYIPHPLDERISMKMIKRMIEQSKSRDGHRRHYELAITLAKEKKVIGMVNLYDIDYASKKCKLGFWVGQNYRRKGYAEEASRAILKFAFKNLKIHKISANTLVINKASNNLLRKIGFKRLYRIKDDQIINGKYFDCYLWGKME